jgi:hypothetical protein
MAHSVFVFSNGGKRGARGTRVHSTLAFFRCKEEEKSMQDRLQGAVLI